MAVTARQRGSTGVLAASELATWAEEFVNLWPSSLAEVMAAFPVSCFPDPGSCTVWTTLASWMRRITISLTCWTLPTSCLTTAVSSG